MLSLVESSCIGSNIGRQGRSEIKNADFCGMLMFDYAAFLGVITSSHRMVIIRRSHNFKNLKLFVIPVQLFCFAICHRDCRYIVTVPFFHDDGTCSDVDSHPAVATFVPFESFQLEKGHVLVYWELGVAFCDNLYGQTTKEHLDILASKAKCARHLLPAGVTSEIHLSRNLSM